MGHTVLSVGDLVQYDAWLAGWLPAKIIETAVVDQGVLGPETQVKLRLTMRKRVGGYNPGEVITVRGNTVLPRAGWHTSRRSVFHVYHVPGWCLAWESCGACERETPPVSSDAVKVAVSA
jgi:hypothetical protein